MVCKNNKTVKLFCKSRKAAKIFRQNCETAWYIIPNIACVLLTQWHAIVRHRNVRCAMDNECTEQVCQAIFSFVLMISFLIAKFCKGFLSNFSIDDCLYKYKSFYNEVFLQVLKLFSFVVIPALNLSYDFLNQNYRACEKCMGSNRFFPPDIISRKLLIRSLY